MHETTFVGGGAHPIERWVAVGSCQSGACLETLRGHCGEDGVGVKNNSGFITHRATSGCLI